MHQTNHLNLGQILGWNKWRGACDKASLCGYSDAYTLVNGTVAIKNTVARGQRNNGANKEVIF